MRLAALTLAILLLSGSLALSAGSFAPAVRLPGGVTLAPGVVPPSAVPTLERATQAVEAAQRQAQDLAEAEGLAAHLERAVALDAQGRFSLLPIPPVEHRALPDALLDLLDAVGGGTLAQRSAAQDLPALDADLAAAASDLAAAMAAGTRLRDQAFAALSPDEMAFLARHADALADARPGPESEQARGLAGKVDLRLLATAAHVVLQAVDGALPQLQAAAARQSFAFAAAPLGPVPAGQSCAVLPPPGNVPPLTPPLPFLNIPGVLAIGSPAAEGFVDDYILSIDLGGNDMYCNNAGSTNDSGHLTPLWDTTSTECDETLPVAVAIDLAGNDNYHGGGTDLSSSFVGCWEGVGQTGVGILVDLSGDDWYNSDKVLIDPTDAPPGGTCPAKLAGTTMTAPVSFSDAISQGTGVLGVGVLLDWTGNDHYDSFNRLCDNGATTTLPFSATLAQGTAATGIGLLLDLDGIDAFNSHNRLLSDDPNVPGALTESFQASLVQGAADVGVGVLLDARSAVCDYNSHNQLKITTSNLDPAPATQTFLADRHQGFGNSFGSVGLLVSLDCRLPFFDSVNTLTSTAPDPGTATSLFTADLGQGAGWADGIGILVSTGSEFGFYDSSNTLTSPFPAFQAFRSQGFGDTIAWQGLGVLVDIDGADFYNSGNRLTGGDGALATYPATPLFPAWAAPSSFITTLDIQEVLGVGQLGGAGIFLDAADSVDDYNSHNVQRSGTPGPGADLARIVATEGAGLLDLAPNPVGALGVFLEIGSSVGDFYNSANSGTPGGSNGILVVAAEGASGVPAPFNLGDGTGLMVTVGGSDTYNFGNAYGVPGPPCGVPWTLNECIDWTHGVSVTAVLTPIPPPLPPIPPIPPLLALFLDVSNGAPDVYGSPAVGSYAMGDYNVGDGVCIDLLDGADTPAGSGCLVDL